MSITRFTSFALSILLFLKGGNTSFEEKVCIQNLGRLIADP